MINSEKYNRADAIGIGISSLCLLHCIATPVLIALGAAFFTQPAVTYLFLATSFTAVFKATEYSTNTKITLLLWISFWGFMFSILFEEEYFLLHYTTYFFSVLVILGHILNIKHCKSCKAGQD